jgi:hypothetical protein
VRIIPEFYRLPIAKEQFFITGLQLSP